MRRPTVRVDSPRRARPDDVHAHRAPDGWPPVEPGEDAVVYVGFGLASDPLAVYELARHLAPARSVRIVARTPAAGRSARSTLSALWRGDLAGGDR